MSSRPEGSAVFASWRIAHRARRAKTRGWTALPGGRPARLQLLEEDGVLFTRYAVDR